MYPLPLSTKSLISSHRCQSLGGEKVRAGTRSAVSGTIGTEVGKKALGEALDSAVADAQVETSVNKPTKRPKTTKNKRTESKDEEAGKKLQRTIKGFLISIHYVSASCKIVSYAFYVGSLFKLRLREKGTKSREMAADLISLGIPHQQASFLLLHGIPK